ncbi:MAG: hypothetical protein RL748_1067 [Pseudomonadota bacterium]|jgi:NAD(P)-dependent dehydrogenase (short-subunit alcohol dehydrogenase family)
MPHIAGWDTCSRKFFVAFGSGVPDFYRVNFLYWIVAMKLAIITGASRGLGLALAQRYACANWQVVNISRSAANRADPGIDSSQITHLPFDMAEVDANLPRLLQLMQQWASQSWSQIVYLNNAGQIGPIGPVASLDEALLARNLEINFMAGIRLMACFVRHFQSHPAQKNLVSISSGAAQRGIFGWSMYCASKAGLDHFVNTLALEQATQENPINCINFGPGVMDTDMQGEIRGASASDFPDLPRFIGLQQNQQLRSAASVAQVVFDLCNNQPQNGRRYVVEEFD